MADEMEIVYRALAGDQSAYSELYDKNKLKVRNLIWKLTKSESDLDDKVQEVFVKAFKSLENFRGEASFSSWLGSIAVNDSRMQWRLKKHSVVSLDDEFDDGVKKLKAELGVRDGYQDETPNRLALTEALSKLPKGFRNIFLWAYVDGYDDREIAKKLRCTLPACKARKNRTRNALKDILGRRTVSGNEIMVPVDTTVESPLLEVCKYGKVEKGRCLTPNCNRHRSHLDTSGYCRDCKIERGLAAKRSQKKTRFDGNLHGAVRHVNIGDTEQLTMDEKFINGVWSLVPQEERITILQLMWVQLPKEVKVRAIRMAMERKREPEGREV